MSLYKIVCWGKPRAKEVKAALKKLRSKQIDVPSTSESDEVRHRENPSHWSNLLHDHQHIFRVHFHEGDASHVEQSNLMRLWRPKHAWENLAWEQRAAIFLKNS